MLSSNLNKGDSLLKGKKSTQAHSMVKLLGAESLKKMKMIKGCYSNNYVVVDKSKLGYLPHQQQECYPRDDKKSFNMSSVVISPRNFEDKFQELKSRKSRIQSAKPGGSSGPGKKQRPKSSHPKFQNNTNKLRYDDQITEEAKQDSDLEDNELSKRLQKIAPGMHQKDKKIIAEKQNQIQKALGLVRTQSPKNPSRQSDQGLALNKSRTSIVSRRSSDKHKKSSSESQMSGILKTGKSVKARHAEDSIERTGRRIERTKSSEKNALPSGTLKDTSSTTKKEARGQLADGVSSKSTLKQLDGELQAGSNKLKMSASMEGQSLDKEALVEKISDEFGHRLNVDSPKRRAKAKGRRQSAQYASKTVHKISSKMEKNLIILKNILEG